ncbi:alpha-(1,3)-fucosyltransferase 10 isoform X2 [Dipodomys merriami]|uniref:alpha-(1,3)-fucosyltransferase 10 isoform X2 n=1 Tax=Dipodomys merriami TaxID=94247 RepID=UPI00384D722F
MVRVHRRKLLAPCLCVTATAFLLVTLQVVVELGKFERKKLKTFQDEHKTLEEEFKHLDPVVKKEALSTDEKNTWEVKSYPIILWWSPLTGETGRLGQCGADNCFFTINRTYQHHPMTKAFLFYGLTTQKMEGGSYPPELPRTHHVCFLVSGASASRWPLFARDVDTKFPAI